MLLKQQNLTVVKSILLTGLLALLASCGNSSALESMVRADPKLKQNNTLKTATNTPHTLDAQENNNNATQDSADDNAATELESTISANDSLEPESSDNQNIIQPKSSTNQDQADLPANFPKSFPIYPQANLTEAKTGQNKDSGMLTWISPDNNKAIADYYQAELIANDWKIIKPFKINAESELARAIAIKDTHKVHLTLLRSNNSEIGTNGTKVSAIYEPLDQNVALNSPEAQTAELESESSQAIKDKNKSAIDNEQKTNNQSLNQTADKNNQGSFPDVVRRKQNELATDSLENDDYLPSANTDFNDLDNVPEPLSQPLKTVAALGILTPYTQEGNVETSKFAPNAIITRGEYARWLIAANNLYHEGDPGKKIYLVNNPTQSAFKDINQDSPDFGAIQGLAEAGLVPSRLTEDSTKLLFRPDAPLTREDLITWKVPLDTRQALPKASIEAIEESWGFQDAANIDSAAIRALYADYQNGDRSNVRRILGFTTLFQPKKPVTRAEAAASLWYFGFQGDGITAQEILELEAETESNS